MLVVVASDLPKLSNKIAYPERNRMEKKLMVTVKSVKCWKALSLDVKLLKALLNWFRKRHMLRASGRLVFASQHLKFAFEDLCLEQALYPKVVQFVIIWDKSRKFVPFIFFWACTCNTHEKKSLCAPGHVVKMTSLKLLLLLTYN